MRKVIVGLLIISPLVLLTLILSGCSSGTFRSGATSQFAFIRKASTKALTATRVAALPRSHVEAHAMSQTRRSTFVTPSIAEGNGWALGTDSILVMKNDGTGEQAVQDSSGSFYKAQLSLDGKKVVFIASDANGYEQVYVESETNTTPIQLTSTGQHQYGAQLSPDGSTAIYVNHNTYPWYAEMVSTSGTGTATQLNVPGYCVHDATFTPDGKKIVFQGHNDSEGLFIVAATGGTPTQLTNVWDYSPSVTADGKKIVFERSTEAGSDIFIMGIAGEIAGSAAVPLTTDGRSEDPLVVNDKIVYVSYANKDGDGDTDIFAMNLDGTGQAQLTALDNQAYEYFDYSSWD